MSTAFNFKPKHMLLFVFAAILALSPGISAGNSAGNHTWGWPQDKWTIHVVNQLGVSRTLTAHCKSGDDDLGIRSLPPGVEFNWSFRMNLKGTTLYWCNTRTDHQHADFQVFWPEDEEKSSWLHYRCNWKECIWVAKDDGIYLRNIPESRDELQHRWEPGW